MGAISMSARLTVALAAVLVFTGSLLAQPPGVGELPPPVITTESSPSTPVGPPVRADSPTDGGLWAAADSVFSWFRAIRLRPLVTTSPPGTPRASAGVLGVPGTSELFGGPVDNDSRLGFRGELGYWFGPDRIWGVEAGFMVIESQAQGFAAASNGTPILARPFIDANNFSSQAVLVAFPGLTTGSLVVRAASGNFYEAHLDFTAKLIDDGRRFRVDSIVGYRFYRYDERLTFQQSMSPTGPEFIPGTQIVAFDDFETRNEFHGLDIGLRSQATWRSLSFDALAKVALGNLHQVIDIGGGTVTTVPGAAPVFQNGGVYALPTNIGSHSSNTFAVLPEFGAALGWRVTDNVQVRVGYSFLWLNQIAHAGDQINTLINPNRFPTAGVPPTGPLQPGFFLERSNSWIQSITVGLQVNF
jgi:hypothetical protein